MTVISVVGIGNSWAGDDGVGPAVIERLREEFARRKVFQRKAKMQLHILSQPGVELLDIMDGCDTLIIVDAVLGHTKPGTIHRLVWRPEILASKGVERASSHGFGVRELLNLAMSLDRLPPQVILWGIEIVSAGPGQGLSPPVAAAVSVVVVDLRQEIENYV